MPQSFAVDPTQAALVPHELFERGRRLAHRLAEDTYPTVLLHGDFTPVNILDGGQRRGLVAIDPCPTLGDPACAICRKAKRFSLPVSVLGSCATNSMARGYL